MRYLALGDSYTVAEGLPKEAAFPARLREALHQEGLVLDPPVVVASTGWTTRTLLRKLEERETEVAGSFDFATLLIGVNNQYRKRTLEDYTEQFEALFQFAFQKVGAVPERLVVLSIPDYSQTPFGKKCDAPEAIGPEIDALNRINRSIAEHAGCPYVDVTPLSRTIDARPELVAADGLHPSETVYTAWLAELLPLARTALARPRPA